MTDIRDLPLFRVPSEDLERAIDFNVRHQSGAKPYDYLKNFLRVARQYGYATQDDSWGELEKELEIAFRDLERLRRFENLIMNMSDDTVLGSFGSPGDGRREDLHVLAEVRWMAIHGEDKDTP